MKRVLIFAVILITITFRVGSVEGQNVTGTGSPGKLSMWVGSHAIANSNITQLSNGTLIRGNAGIGSGINPSSQLDVRATSAPNAVLGFSKNGTGVEGDSFTGDGVIGDSLSNRGVFGVSRDKGGVVGMSSDSDGTVGVACQSTCGAAGIVGIGHRAGTFMGNVGVMGIFAVTGVKAFHIDHPLDPANKYLNHFSVESNEVLNTYSGNITTDLSGAATVILPSYFATLNGDYRYQLTVIGQFAQAIVSREIENNNFVIKTDKPSVRVSWQVTGVRQDAWVRNHPVTVEEDKSAAERGYYLHPELVGQPEEKSIMWLYHSDAMRDAKALWSREVPNSQ